MLAFAKETKKKGKGKEREEPYPNRHVKRGNQTDDVQNQANITTSDTHRRAVGHLLDRVALGNPGAAEPDMSEADGAPDEEIAETTQTQQPGENSTLLCTFADESKQTKSQLNDSSIQRTALLVNMGQKARSHAALCKGLQCASRAKGARVGNTDDRKCDDDVENRGQCGDTSVKNGIIPSNCKAPIFTIN